MTAEREPTSQPSVHRAWARALAGPLDATLAGDLAEQVCAVPAERDWMLHIAQEHPDALDAVVAPAVGALFAAWIEAVHPYEPRTQGAVVGARRVSFAALCAAAGHLAWAQREVHRAHIYAFRALDADPDAPGAPTAYAILAATRTGRAWTVPSGAERAAAAAAVLEYRASARQ